MNKEDAKRDKLSWCGAQVGKMLFPKHNPSNLFWINFVKDFSIPGLPALSLHRFVFEKVTYTEAESFLDT